MLPPILTSGIDLANHVLAFAITLVGFLALFKKKSYFRALEKK